MNLFEGLESLGLETSGIELYTKKEERNSVQINKKEKIIKDSLYYKTIECPVCYTKSKVRAVRSSAPRVIKRDTDFMAHYGEVNPLLYGVLLCNECGYAGVGDHFNNIREKRKEAFIQEAAARWKKMNIPDEHTIDFAIKQYKLALLSAVIKEAKASEKALICLRLSWLYRLNHDEINEHIFQKEAIVGYEEADLSEDFPIPGLSENNLRYLLGELHRRVGMINRLCYIFQMLFLVMHPIG